MFVRPANLVPTLRIAALATAAMSFFVLEAGEESRILHIAVFYICTLGALAALPWNRKADVALGAICLAAAWEAVHGAAAGAGSLQLLAIDVLGVGLAAAPVWIARLRQMAQQDRFAAPFGSDRRARQRPRVRHLRAWIASDAAHEG
jgi:hypothetical protein